MTQQTNSLGSTSLRADKTRKKRKLVVLVTHPIQYFAPVYRAIAKENRIDISVIFLTDAGACEYFDKDFGKSIAWDVDLLSGYRSHVLRPGLDRVPKRFLKTRVPELPRLLAEEDPEAILIYGYTRWFNWTAWRWARRRRCRLLYCSDSVLLRKRANWRLWLKAFVLPWFFRGVDTFLAAGEQNRDYFLHYKVPPANIIRCPLPVDVQRLRAGCGSVEARTACRRSLGLRDGDFVVLQCGKLSKVKRPLDLAKAIFMLRERGYPAVGVFVGSGALMGALEGAAKSSQCPQSIICTGFVNQSALFNYYAAADVLAIPSEEEAYGLVATEASAFGLPIIASDQVGCVGLTDAAQPGHNALVFRCGDCVELEMRIEELITNAPLREEMGRAGLRIAETRDIAVAADIITGAVLNSSNQDK